VPPSAVVSEGPEAPLFLEVRPDSLTDAVYEAIRRGIIDRRLAPGSPVTEAALAEQLGVSKTPVREALLRLKDIGVIEPNGKRGGRVVQLSEVSVRRAYEVRDALEPYAAGRAAGRAEADQVAELRSLAERSLACVKAGDVDGFTHHDIDFHTGVAEAASNPLLRRMVEDALTLALTLRRRARPKATASLACAEAHLRIADAIADGDAAIAEREMRAHIGFVAGMVLAGPLGTTTDEVGL
jgi:DNA-binding GntR family transcriptional regulator